MGLRETLNENPRIVTGITAGVVLVILVAIIWSSSGGGGPPATVGAGGALKVFFTDDDGKTWFPDDSTKVPPFDRGGKQAVRAHVYKCNGKEFVNHMERYTPAGQKKAQEIYSKDLARTDPTSLEVARQTGMEVKKPGQTAWVKLSDYEKAQQIMQPKCPDGGGELERVSP